MDHAAVIYNAYNNRKVFEFADKLRNKESAQKYYGEKFRQERSKKNTERKPSEDIRHEKVKRQTASAEKIRKQKDSAKKAEQKTIEMKRAIDQMEGIIIYDNHK